MGAEEATVGGWNTWEELILGAAVLRHGRHDWNVVASELRARTRYPTLFTPQVCKSKYEDLQKRYAGSRAWFEELRKQCMAELKHELARSEASIGFLESKIKHLEAERQNHNQPGYDSGQTDSPSPALNSDGTGFSSQRISTDEQSFGSYSTENTRTRTYSSCEHQPLLSAPLEHDKDSSIERLAEACFGEGTITRKRRGKRKRKGSNQAVKEGSVGDSDNLGSSIVISSSQKDTTTPTPGCDQIRDSPMEDNRGCAYIVDRNSLMEIFEPIAESEPAVVFRHRMDGQKRARYRRIIRQHIDIDTIRSKIIGGSIKSAKELFRDLLLVATNALVFYSTKTREHKAALSLRHLVMREYKQHFRVSCNDPTPSFLPFNPPVKPRSARPPPHIDNISPAGKPRKMKRKCDTEYDFSLSSLLKAKKGVKQSKVVAELANVQKGVKQSKVVAELANVQPKSSPKKRTRISR